MPRELPISIGIFAVLYLMSNPSTLASMPAPVIHLLASIRDKIGGLGVVSVIWKGLVAAHAAESVAMTGYLLFFRGASFFTAVSGASPASSCLVWQPVANPPPTLTRHSGSSLTFLLGSQTTLPSTS